MSERNESFVFYRSFMEALDDLPAEQYKAAMSAILHYGIDGELPSDVDPVVQALFKLMKPQVDANVKRRNSGRSGADKRWNDGKAIANDSKPIVNDSKHMASDSKPMATPCEPIANANANANANVNANVNTPPNPPSQGDSAPDPRFEDFWKEYPKKVGKQDALKAWKKIHPSAALVTTIMSTLGRAKDTDQWRRDGGRYVPNPSTWLNQGRYDDDPSTYPTGRASPDTRFHNMQQRTDDIEDYALKKMMAELEEG